MYLCTHNPYLPYVKLLFKTITLLLALFAMLPVMAVENSRVFKVLNASDGLVDNSAQMLVCTKTGRMIISTIGNLNFYDGHIFTHADLRQEFQYQLPLYFGGYRMAFDNYHHLWVKNTNVTACLDLMLESYSENVDSIIHAMGCADAVQDLFIDSRGEPWFLTEKGLVGLKERKTFNVMRDCSLQDLDVCDNLLLTFYDNGEEMAQDTLTGNVVHRTKAYDWDTAQQYLTSSSLLRYGNGYFQLRKGKKGSVLLFFNIAELSWTILFEKDYHMNSMTLEDGLLYIPCEYGYMVYDPVTGRTDHYDTLRLNDGGQLKTYCNAIAFDKQGGMWIGTERRGLLYAPPMSTLFKVYPLGQEQGDSYAGMMASLTQNITDFKGKQANCKFVDSRGWTWIGTMTGLYLQRTSRSEPELFTKRNGLTNNVVHSITEDKDHNIWISTSYGITFLLIQGGKVGFVNSFTANDNIPDETFANSKAMCLDDGTIVMQGLDNVVAFQPSDFKTINIPHPYKLFPKLTRLLVDGNVVYPNVEVDGQVIIDRAITRVRDIYLRNDQNSVSLIFSPLNYFRPKQSFFRVRVKGLADEWRELSYSESDMIDEDGLLHLPLLGLRPGDYYVELQASLFPGVWEGDPFVWVIHVEQYWWLTRGVFYILGVLLLGLLVVNFYLYNKNTRMRDRRNVEEGDIIRKIRLFVDRCEAYSAEPMAPVKEDIVGGKYDARMQLSPEFIDLMLKLIPYVNDHQSRLLTMRQLSEVGGIEIVRLYEILSGNLYKSPRDLSCLLRLRKSARLLLTTDMTIEQISMACRFYTPNYFMGNFFHEYKQTPSEYRRNMKQ